MSGCSGRWPGTRSSGRCSQERLAKGGQFRVRHDALMNFRFWHHTVGRSPRRMRRTARGAGTPNDRQPPAPAILSMPNPSSREEATTPREERKENPAVDLHSFFITSGRARPTGHSHPSGQIGSGWLTLTGFEPLKNGPGYGSSRSIRSAMATTCGGACPMPAMTLIRASIFHMSRLSIDAANSETSQRPRTWTSISLVPSPRMKVHASKIGRRPPDL